MVYVASLSLVAKKALGSKCHQSSVEGIIKTLPIDPAVSNMDVVLFGPQDITGVAGKRLIAAVESRHKNICVIYVCTNDKEQRLFPQAPHVKVVKRIRDNIILDVVNEFYGQDVKVADPEFRSNADRVGPLGDNPSPIQPVMSADIAPKDIEPAPAMPNLPTVEPVLPQEQDKPSQKIEEVIDSIKSVQDWGILKQQFNRDGMIRQLILENNEFSGLVSMLDVFDLKIREVFSDSRKSNEEKLAAIKEFGANRQVLQATYNSVAVSKFVALTERLISGCTAAVEQRIDDVTHAVASVQTSKEDYVLNAIRSGEGTDSKLYDSMLELQSIVGELCELYSYLHHVGMDEMVAKLNENLPSQNAFINNMVDVTGKLFLPGNSVDLGRIIIDSLSNGQVQLSLLEDKLKGLMQTIFSVIKDQHKEIEYQRKVIDLLRANRVEDIVIRDSLLKDCFKIILGAPNTGLTSTAVTYAGMLSRQHNTLLVDISGHSHYDRYGYETVSLDDFMVERIQKPLLVVVGQMENDPEAVFKLMEELKSRLNYFHHLVVVIDTAQTEIIDQLGREALSISYVTNCTLESMDAIKKVYGAARYIPNVCHKLICIDSPVDIGTLTTSINMDIATTQLIPLPYLREMRHAALVGQQPHTFNDVLRVFEEAFRV